MKKKVSKYEEVIIKTILANQIFDNNFFNTNDQDQDLLNWRDEVNKIYNDPNFDVRMVLAQFIANGSFEHNKEYEVSNFIPENINDNIDDNIEKKFIQKDENKPKDMNLDTYEEDVNTNEENQDMIED